MALRAMLSRPLCLQSEATQKMKSSFASPINFTIMAVYSVKLDVLLSHQRCSPEQSSTLCINNFSEVSLKACSADKSAVDVGL